MQKSNSNNTFRNLLKTLEGYIYLAPTLIVLGIFVYYPIVSSFQMSLTRVAPFGGKVIDVGLENYQRLWTEIVRARRILQQPASVIALHARHRPSRHPHCCRAGDIVVISAGSSVLAPSPADFCADCYQ